MKDAIGKIAAGLNGQRFGSATGFDETVANAIAIGYNLTGAGDSLSIYRTDVYLMG